MGATQIRIEGRALASGQPAALTLVKRPGPVTVAGPGWPASLPLDACLVGAERHTSYVARPRGRAKGPEALHEPDEAEQPHEKVRTVEHLASALAGMRIYSGLHIEFHAPELPLLDGGAREFVAALEALELESTSPNVAVLHPAEFTIGATTFVFEPSTETHVQIELVTEHPALERHAGWNGSPSTYREGIAGARTFMFQADVDAYLAQGTRVSVDPEAVFVVGSELHAAAAVASSEPARHKLLDLLGDLYLYGGPPQGTVRVRRPGHAATHEAMRLALARGVLGVRSARGSFTA